MTENEISYTLREELPLPPWIIKLARRLLGLERGYRYHITLTLTAKPDWTIIQLGKIEN